MSSPRSPSPLSDMRNAKSAADVLPSTNTGHIQLPTACAAASTPAEPRKRRGTHFRKGLSVVVKWVFLQLVNGDLHFDPSTGLFYEGRKVLEAPNAAYWPDLVAKVRNAFKVEWRFVPLHSMAVPP